MARLTLKKLKPEEKVNLSISITDVCVRICANAVKDRNPTIREKGLIEQVRARIMYGKRRHCEV